MARFQTLQCPDCEGTFRWLQHPSDEPLPNFCPKCGSSMTAEPVFVPLAPHIGRTIGKTADNVYRQMETASVANMEAAAELGGGDTSDYSALKVSDMADYLRPGDVAAKMPANPVSEHMAKTGIGGFQPGMTGAEYAANVRVGAFPRQGETTRVDLVSGHSTRARGVEAAGRIGRAK